jgi:hypothetical protein
MDDAMDRIPGSKLIGYLQPRSAEDVSMDEEEQED